MRRSRHADKVAERDGSRAGGRERGRGGAGGRRDEVAARGSGRARRGKARGWTASTPRRSGSGVAEAPDAVADAAHGGHKFWRKWTLRIPDAAAAAIGYRPAPRGCERDEQIVGGATSLSVRGAECAEQGDERVIPDDGNPTV